MSYSCLEELQVDLDLHALDKTNILSKAGHMYDDGWLIVTDDGVCHLFDKYGNLDDSKKITRLKEEYIRKDITKIVIPDSVTSIGYYAFLDCSDLTSVTIPDSVTNIGDNAFDGCTNLTSITIGNSVMSIGKYTFADCKGLTSVMIGNSVSSIETYAFFKCSGLTSIIIPDGVTSIGIEAFYYCRGLTSVMIGNSVTSIGYEAFKGCCDKLTNLTFKGKTLKQIKEMKYYPWGIKNESIIQVE